MTLRSSVRRKIGLVALVSLVLALLPFGPHVESAQATVGTGAITIVSTGGSSAGTDWTFTSGTITTVDGDPASIDASDVVGYLNSGNLTIQAASITVNANVVATTGSSSLTLSTTGDIDVKPAISLTTLGGNMSLLADSEGNGTGGIRIGDEGFGDALLSSHGGSIILGGGGGSSSNSAGLSSFPPPASSYYYSVGVESATIDAGGGDIAIRGFGGTASVAKIWCVHILDTVKTSGAGAIEIHGDCGSLPTGANNPWGVVHQGVLQTASGPITVEGKSSVARANARGFTASGYIQSLSGAITLRDGTSGTSDSDYTGPYINGVNLGQGTLASSSSNINIYADEMYFAPNVNTTGTLTVAPAASDFQATLTIPSASSISNISGLTLGSAGNTQDIAIQETFTVVGTLTIFSNGAVSQSAEVTATSLSLNGSGSFTLADTSNNFGTIAGGASGSELGSVSVYDASGGLTIGTVGSLEGIAATGDVLVETGAGDITLAKSIATDSTSSSAITLNAGDSTAAGTSTGGNIVVSGSPTLTTGTGGIVRLFSGDDSGSTGLTTLAGGPSNTYYGVDETSSLSPALSAGTAYALYRGKETPQLSSLSNRSVTVGAASVTLTDPTATNRSSASVGGTVAWTTSNSSVALLSGSTLSYGSVGTATITATFTPTDTASYNSATTTFTVTVSAASSGGSSSSSSSSTVATPVAPVAPTVNTQTPRPLQATLNTNPVPRPVERLGLVFDPDAPSRATVGGAFANLVKTPVGSKGLSVAAGAFQFGVSLADADGAEVQTDTPSQSPELFVPRGQSAAVSGKGSYPGSFVQLFLPGNGDDSRELARIPVRSDGTFASDFSFQAGALELPVPIGRQVLQVVGYDELGNQTVVDMTVNIGQGVPAPEPNRQAGALPALTAGQSLATSGGIPETVSVTGIPDAGNVVVEGSGWVINVNADRDNGVVETTGGNVLVRLNPASVGTASGSGFLPGTLATVWLFSEPTLVATVSVDDAGEFSAEFLVDQRLISPGEHTLQVQGVGSDGYIKATNLGVLIEEPVELTTESASNMLWWVVGAFVLALVLLLFVLARKRRRDA